MEFRLNLVQRYKLAVKNFSLSSNHLLYFQGFFLCFFVFIMRAAGTYEDRRTEDQSCSNIKGCWRHASTYFFTPSHQRKQESPFFKSMDTLWNEGLYGRSDMKVSVWVWHILLPPSDLCLSAGLQNYAPPF